MTEWVTIKVPKPTRDEASEDERTYEEIIQAGLGDDSEPYAEVAVDMDASTIRSVVSDEIEKHLSEITVNVDMGGLDLDGSELTADDVEAIVTREIEKHVHEKARQV